LYFLFNILDIKTQKYLFCFEEETKNH
jgi:hypothetical protein